MWWAGTSKLSFEEQEMGNFVVLTIALLALRIV
jgi:hypothetical protein